MNIKIINFINKMLIIILNNNSICRLMVKVICYIIFNFKKNKFKLDYEKNELN